MSTKHVDIDRQEQGFFNHKLWGYIYIYTHIIYIYTYTLYIYIYMCVCGFVQEWHMGKLAISMVENDDQRLGCPRAPMFGQALGVI